MGRKRERTQRDNTCKMEDNKTKSDYSKAQKQEKMVDKETHKNTRRNNNQVNKSINKQNTKSNNFLRGVITNPKGKSNTKQPESIASTENDDSSDWETFSISELPTEQRKDAKSAASKLSRDQQPTPVIIDSEADEVPVLVIEGKMSELKEDLEETTAESGSSTLDDEEISTTESDASSKDGINDETRSILQISIQNKREQNILKNEGQSRTKNYLGKMSAKSGSQNVCMLRNKMVVENKSENYVKSANEEWEICSTKLPESLTKMGKIVSKTCERNEKLEEMKRLDLSNGSVDFNYAKKETERIELGTCNKGKSYDDVSFITAQMEVKVVKVNTSVNTIKKKTLRSKSEKPPTEKKNKTSKPEEGKCSDKCEEGANEVELSHIKSSEDSCPKRNESLQNECGIQSMQEKDTQKISRNNSLTSRKSLKQRDSVSDNTREATCPIKNRKITIFQKFSEQKAKNKSVETTRSWKKAKRKELQSKSGCETVNTKENENWVVKPKSSLMIARAKLKNSAISWSSASNQSIAKESPPLIEQTDVQEIDGYQAPPPSVVSSIFENDKIPGENVTLQPDASASTSEAPRPSLCEQKEGQHGVKIKPKSSSSLKKLKMSLPKEVLNKSTASKLAIRVQPQVKTSNDDVRPSGDHVPERTHGPSSEDEIRSSRQRSLLQEKSKVLLKENKSNSITRRKKMWNNTQTKSAVLSNHLPSETSSKSVQPCLLRTNNVNRSKGPMRSSVLQSSASLKPGANKLHQQHIPKAKTETYLVRNTPSDSANYSTSPKETTSTSNSRLTPKLHCDSSSIDTINSRKRTWCVFKSLPNSQEPTEMEPQYHTDSESQDRSSSGTENTRKRRRLTSLAHTKSLKISAQNSFKSVNSCSENKTVLNIGSSTSNKKTKSTSHLTHKSTDSLTLPRQSESKMIHQSSSQIECRHCSPYEGSKTPRSTPTFSLNTPVINESHSQINCTQCSPYEGANRSPLKVSLSAPLDMTLSKLSQIQNSSLQYQRFLITKPSQSMTEMGRHGRSPFPPDSTYERRKNDEIKGEQTNLVTSDLSRAASAHQPLYSITSPCLTPSPLLSFGMNEGSTSPLQIQDQTMSETSLVAVQVSQPLSPQSERISTTATSSQSSDSSGSHTQRWKDLVANSQLRIIPSASQSQCGFRPCSPSCGSYEQLKQDSREDLLNLPPCKTVRRTRSPPRLPPCVNPKKRRRVRKVKRVQKAIPKTPDSSDPRESIERSLTWRDRPVTTRDKRRGPYFTLVPFAPGGRLAREGPVAASRGRASLPPGPIGGACNGCGPCALAQPHRSYWSQSNNSGTFIGGIGPFSSGTSSNKDAAVEHNVEGDAYDKNGDFNEPWALFVATEAPSDLWQQLPGGECCCTKDEKPEKPGLQVIVSGHALSPECESNDPPASIQQIPSAGEGSESDEQRSIPLAVETESLVVTTIQPPSRTDTRRRERWVLRALRTFDAWISPRSCTRRPPASSQRIHSAPVERSPEPVECGARIRPSSEISRIPWWRKMRKTIFRDKFKEK